MDFDQEGVLYVVGGEALNRVLADEPNVRDAPTGFVKSMFYRVESPCSDSPSVQSRDMNLAPLTVSGPLAKMLSFFGIIAEPIPLIVPVEHEKALSQLTDLAIWEGPEGQIKVFVTAFGNDRVGIIEPDSDQLDPNLWPLRRLEIPARNGSPMAGPRGIAIKSSNSAFNADPGARVYVLNHLDSSVTVIDPVAEKVIEQAGFSLTHDPRPLYLTQGQRFLYDARLSGNGMVSCASCHIDGRTDGLAWDLGNPGAEEVKIPEILLDAVDDTHFPADKGLMVTQSLQGLLNYEAVPHQQFWVTNGPYHWRGDKANFREFNGAFRSLLGGHELSELEMKQFEEFVFTIHYPPNPKQLASRKLSGVFDPDASSLAGNLSTGANRGMRLFHTFPTVGPRTCVHCHALPEGSNNRITDPASAVGQPIESAALRGLFQKEAKRDIDGSSHPKDSPYTGLEGLFHTGFIANSDLHELNFVGSINSFNKTFFSSRICGTPGEISFCEDIQDLNQFVHEFDWGVAPLVGCAVTVRRSTAAILLAPPPPDACSRGCSDPKASLACMRDQSDKANVSMVAQVWSGGQLHGFWWDPTLQVFRQADASNEAVDEEKLVDLLKHQRDRIVIQAVPLGDERRLASRDGLSGEPLSGAAPESLRLLSLVPNDFYQDVPRLSENWADFDNSQFQSIFIHTVRLFQWGLILDAESQNGFGLENLRHDAPRRLRISGENIRPGAWLHVAYHSQPGGGPIDPLGPVNQVNIEVISFPIYPTGKRDSTAGSPIYETAIELEPLIYYGLMLGGPAAPGVAAAYLDTGFEFPLEDPVTDRPPIGQFAPLKWNYLYVFVTNQDNTWGAGGWQRLRLAP